MLEHTVLMDTGFVSKGIGTDNGLVRLYRKSGELDTRREVGTISWLRMVVSTGNKS